MTKTKRMMIDVSKLSLRSINDLSFIYDAELYFSNTKVPFLCVAEIIDYNGQGITDETLYTPERMRWRR